MGNENARLLLGLGIGTFIGVAVGYLLTEEHRRKLEEELRTVGRGIRDGVESVLKGDRNPQQDEK